MNFKMIQTTTLIGSLGLLASACASITSLTTAKTLKAGESQWTVAGTYSNLKLKTDDVVSGSSPSLTTPGIDVAYRRGLTDDDEIGLRLAGTMTYYQGDYKRALLKGGPLELSIGGGLGGTQYSVGTESTTIVDFYLPTVYVDFNVSDNFTIFTAPKFIYRKSTLNGGSGSQMAVSGGIKWGKSAGVIVEGGWTKFFKDGVDSGWQLAAGFFF